ncbi:MAG: hypothetical protein GEU91_10040 [Rhizobiales bacterium]|nr:hypothetical protein [Hyphomicrobiales bacterium]
MSDQYWFKPKVFGYGASPTTWEGWAVVAGYCAVVTIVTLAALIIVEPGTVSASVQWLMWLVWLAVVAIATAVLTVVSKRRTDGEWRWRWGRRADAMSRGGPM